MGSLVSSFAKSGIWPVDPSGLNKEALAPSAICKMMPQIAQATSDKENIPSMVQYVNSAHQEQTSQMQQTVIITRQPFKSLNMPFPRAKLSSISKA